MELERRGFFGTLLGGVVALFVKPTPSVPVLPVEQMSMIGARYGWTDHEAGTKCFIFAKTLTPARKGDAAFWVDQEKYTVRAASIMPLPAPSSFAGVICKDTPENSEVAIQIYGRFD